AIRQVKRPSAARLPPPFRGPPAVCPLRSTGRLVSLLAPTFEVEAKEPVGLSVEPAHVNDGWIRARVQSPLPDFLPVTVNNGLRIGRKCRILRAVFSGGGAAVRLTRLKAE